jgi:hypothetical protein
MKVKLMSLVVATLFFFSCGTTYTSTSSNAAYGLPDKVRTNFVVLYPDATNVAYTQFDAATVPIDWELTGWPALASDDYAVNFDQGGRRYTAWFDSDGAWIGTTYSVNSTMLPSAVSTLLRDKYDGYTVESIQRESWKDQSAYEIKLKNADDSKVKLLVDMNGNILKQKSE